ncbi:MAG: hypothetical protein HY820_38175 [Acidobacteria bacterium]|nr:hypothetical protein [Acidobacteriota bacterium]
MTLKTLLKTLAASLIICAAAEAGDRMGAEIPFDFKVGAIHLASGVYTVERYSVGASYALELTNRRTGSRFHVLLRSEERRQVSRPALEFYCESGTCELHSVSLPSELWTIRVPLARARAGLRLQAVALQPNVAASAVSSLAGIR